MTLYLKNYITPEGEQAIRNFKYKGSSSAFSYDYLWSPLAEYMLRFIPFTWAPNAITLVGFILVLIAACSIYMFGTLGDPVSSGQALFFAVCIFTYQTLDNIDGKQARRTGTSTPLGMLFDHGCDSMSCFLLSVSLSRIFMVTNEKLLMFGIFLGVQLIFYMSVWAQYHSKGIMHLGKVNAVDDGIPAIWLLAIFSSIVGTIWWKETTFGIERGVLLFYGILISALRTDMIDAVQSFSLVFNTGKEFTKDVRGAMKHLLHILCLTCSLAMITELTDWWKVDRYYNQIIFSLGIMYVRNTTYMQLCVTTNQPYNQFTTANFMFSAGYPIYILTHMILGKDIIPEWLFINGMLVFFVINYIHFAVSIVYHMSLILGIHPFTIRDQLLKKGMIDAEGNRIIKPDQKKT